MAEPPAPQALSTYPFWLAGEPVAGEVVAEIRSPFDGRVVATVGQPDSRAVERAVQAAVDAFPVLAQTPAHVRAEALAHVARRLLEERERFAESIVAESGKPIKLARLETVRAAANFRTASEETRRIEGTFGALDGDPIGAGRIGVVRRFPVGPVLGITPFNFPLNLVAHKLAPALAVGAPLVLKPAPKTPVTACLLAELVAETDLPGGALSVLPIPNGPELDALVRDPRLPIVSFTGSEVGWELRAALPRKRVLLELGGNAAAVVHRDAPDLDQAAQSIAIGAFAQAGQTCISTQRVLVHADVAEEFTAKLLDATAQLGTGDPLDETTVVGPLVTEAAAERVSAWVDEALDAGARKLCGGEREGNTYAPTLLADVGTDARVWREEIFGPVATVSTFDDIDDAFGAVNASRFGLQAGIFTTDLQVVLKAHRELEVGTVIVGDSPSYRADPLMPYGGWKDSGVGREGVRAAMDELTEVRSLVMGAD